MNMKTILGDHEYISYLSEIVSEPNGEDTGLSTDGAQHVRQTAFNGVLLVCHELQQIRAQLSGLHKIVIKLEAILSDAESGR